MRRSYLSHILSSFLYLLQIFIDLQDQSQQHTTMYNNKMWYGLPFCSCNLSVDPTEYIFNIDSNNLDSNKKLSMFKNGGTRFIHLNVNSVNRILKK